jgi:hypothetical protein
MASGLQEELPRDTASAELFHSKRAETEELVASGSFEPIVEWSPEVLTTRRRGVRGLVMTGARFWSEIIVVATIDTAFKLKE